MCDLTGGIYTICGMLLLLKYVAKKCKMQRLNQFLAKCHKEVGILFLVIGIAHIIASIPLLSENGFPMILFGCVGFIAGLFLVGTGFFIRKNRKALIWHRWSAIVFCIGALLHMFR